MTGKKRIMVIAFCIFLGFMAVCTMLAKGIYRAGLPRVTVTAPQRKSISHIVEAAGTVKQGQEYGVYVEQGLRVATIVVREGETVEAGAPLFQIDLNDLTKIIDEKELNIEKLTAQQKETASATGQEQQKENLTVARSQQDYQKALRDAELMLSRKRLLLTEAQKALDDYKKYLSDTDGQVSAGDADTAQGRKDKLKELEQAVTVAAQSVEDAILAKEDALLTASREIENADLAAEQAYSSAETVNQLELAYQQKTMEELKNLLNEQGWVCAEEPGKITQRTIKVGERTPDGACLLYALDEGDRLLEVPLTQEQAKYIELGDELALSYRNVTGAHKDGNGTVSYLSQGTDGSTVARVELDDADVSIGQPISISLTKQSDPYETCISASAVKIDTAGTAFIYVVEEQEGILGTEWKITRVQVKVLDRNEYYAAIENSSLTKDSLIVESANKKFGEGDVVRIVE